MNVTIQYYLGDFATRQDLSAQAKTVRDILSRDDESIVKDISIFIAHEQEMNNDTANIINIAVMPAYGSEYLGLGGSDWMMKATFFKQLVAQFPAVNSFKFKYADCAVMAGISVQDFYPILEQGMLADDPNKYYPSTELFELIQESEFNFVFDLLLLDKYRQPCSKKDFDDYLQDLKEQYTTTEQILHLNAIEWKGNYNK